MNNYSPKIKGFTKRFVAMNGLSDFKYWIFEEGMQYNSEIQWWNNKKRSSPHEGLDFGIFKTHNGTEEKLTSSLEIPSVLDGGVYKLGTDFIGESIFVESEICIGVYKLFVIYGHVAPANNIDEGKRVGENDLIAKLADPSIKGLQTPAHLHLSFAWIPKFLPYDELNWDLISQRKELILIDPSEVIDCSNSSL